VLLSIILLRQQLIKGDFMLLDQYEVTLRLTEEQLGTNPMNPDVLDTFIIEKQRKLILEKSKINKALNKYAEAQTISKDRSDKEIESLLRTVEEVVGTSLTREEASQLFSGDKVDERLSKLRDSLEGFESQGATVFFRDDKGKPCIGSHMIKGFLKAAGEAFARTMPTKNGTMLQSNAYTSSIINQHVTVTPHFITASKDILRSSDKKPKYLQRSLRVQTAMGPRVTLAKSEVLPAGTEFKFVIKVMSGSPFTKEIMEQLFSYGELSGLGQWRNSAKGQFEVVQIKEITTITGKNKVKKSHK
jgi:hypothetical protein